jgi:mono/diheme cytochrome c family protein
MPAFAWVLNDDQVAAVVTYIRQCLGQRGTAGEQRYGEQDA